jgi:type IV pilus biogenesis protein CpaD/CtpE
MTAKTSRLALAAVALLLLAGCPPSDRPASAATADSTDAAKPILRLAGVERIEIVVLETRPVQVRVAVYGWLSDSCTTIRNTEQTREGALIRLKIITTRPAGVMCAQMIKRFRDTYPVETAGLPPGTYTLDVSGKQAQFTLP